MLYKAFSIANRNVSLELWVQKGRTDARISPLVDIARQHGVTVRFVERSRLDAKVEGTHQGYRRKSICRPGLERA